MARVKVEELLESLDSDLRVAIGRAVNRMIPNAQFDVETPGAIHHLFHNTLFKRPLFLNSQTTLAPTNA